MPAGKMKLFVASGKSLKKKAQDKNTRKIAKEVMLSLAETKVFGGQSVGGPTTPAYSLDHNIPLFFGKMLSCTQGTQDSNDYAVRTVRIGDEVILKNVNVRFMLSALRPNVTYKLVLFWYTEGQVPSNAMVYFTQGNKLLDRYNTEQISIIDQKIISPNIGSLPADDANPRRTRLVTLNGNWKSKRIIYNEGGADPKYKNIGYAIVAYDSINSLQTDAIGEYIHDYKIRFKDL